MIKRSQHVPMARLELCKLYEHRLQRYADALKQCDILLKNTQDEGDTAALMKRRNRIEAKSLKRGGTHV